MMLDRTSYYTWLNSEPGVCHFCEYKNTGTLIEDFGDWVWAVSISPVWKWHTMLYPKRHVVNIIELTPKELVRMFKLHKRILDIYRKLDKAGKFGDSFLKYEMLFRERDSQIDPITGNVKPDHFHLNIYPFHDHHTDVAMDKDAYHYDLRKVLGGDFK